MFEHSPASGESAQDTYLRYVRSSDIFVWLVGDVMTQGVAAEVNAALALHSRMFVFRTPVARDDPPSAQLLAKTREIYTSCDVRTPEELSEAIRASLQDEIARAMRSRAFQPSRTAQLQFRALESWARTKSSWQTAGLEAPLAAALADDESLVEVIKWESRVPEGGVTLLSGPLGSGKTLIGERLYQTAARRAAVNSDSPIPVWRRASRFEAADFRDLIESATQDLGSPSGLGAFVVIDGLDEVSMDVALKVIEGARELVALWPCTRVLLTSRPIPDLVNPSEELSVSPLSDEAALALISRVSGRELPSWHVAQLPPSLRESVRYPLFALLYGGWIAQHSQDPGTPGQLVDGLVDRVLRRSAGRIGDVRTHLEKLAAQVTTRGGPVPKAQVGAGMTELLGSGLVVHERGAVTLGLPVLTQWFAAQALGHGIVQVQDIAPSVQILYRWRYALQIFINTISRDRVGSVLETMVACDPGLVGLVIQDETPFASRPSESDVAWIPTAQAAGEAVRHAMEAWADGIGPLAAAIAPIDIDGGVRSVAAGLRPPVLTTAWLRSRASGDVVELAPSDLGLEGPRSVAWTSCRGQAVLRESYWEWKRTLDELVDGLSQLLEDRVPLLETGPLAREAAWTAAGVVLGRRFNSYHDEPVSIEEIEKRTSGLSDDCGFSTALGRRVEHPLRPLRAEIARLSSLGESVIRPPWPGPDRDMSDESIRTFAELFSDEQLLRHVTQVYEAVMETYLALCEGPLVRLAPHLSTYLMMPARLVGKLKIPSHTDEGWLRQPSLQWYLEPLPAGSTNDVDIRIGPESPTPEQFPGVLEAVRLLRPESADRISVHFTGELLDMTTAAPLMQVAYEWLWNDLRRIRWVKGTFSRFQG